MPKLLKAASFRLTIGYLVLFSLSALTLLIFVYVSAAAFIEQQSQDTIRAEITGLVEQYQTRGLVGLRQVIAARAAAEPDRRSVYLLMSPRDTALAGNIDRWPETGTADEEGFRFAVRIAATGGEHSVLARRFRLPDGSRLLVGRDIEDRLAIQSTLWNTLLYGGGVMLLLALGGGLLTSRLMLGRIDRINKTVSGILTGNDARVAQGGELAERVPLGGSGDEYDDLATNLNAMLGRIERLVQGMREVSDNIAHDLRTPLNRMRGRLDVSLRDHNLTGEGRRIAEETIADCDQLIATFNALLSIARAEAGARDRWRKFDLSDMVDDVFDLYEPLSEQSGMTLKLVRSSRVSLFADRQLLSQTLANLIDNAIKYGAEGGTIEVGFDASPKIWVSDQGAGIPLDKRAQVFERFSRLDADRSTPGNGLGLSLVQAVVRLHEGRLQLEDNAPGLKISVILPKGLKNP